MDFYYGFSKQQFFYWKFLPNFNLKNMISIYAKDFSWKNDPNARKKFQIARFL
jgi:hypothetical protein